MIARVCVCARLCGLRGFVRIRQAFGIIFVIDCSLSAPFDRIRDILHETMHNKHVRGKPLLIVANKQDLDESIDVIDLTYFFRVDELCNVLGTPCLIVPSGKFDHADLDKGFGWLLDNVVDNYKALKNRMRFNVLSPIKRFRRQRTSLPMRVSLECIRNGCFEAKRLVEWPFYV